MLKYEQSLYIFSWQTIFGDVTGDVVLRGAAMIFQGVAYCQSGRGPEFDAVLD